MNTEKQAVVAKMKRHCPVPNFQVGPKCALRWATVGSLALLLPVGAVMARYGSHPWDFSGPVAILLALVGFWGVGVGWMELRQQGLSRQWGLCPLTPAQCVELQEVVAPYPELEREVDEWLVRWVDAGSQLRGRDLVFLRRCVREWEAASRAGQKSAPARTTTTTTALTETE